MKKIIKKNLYSQKSLTLFLEYLEDSHLYIYQEPINFYFRVNKKIDNNQLEINQQAVSNILNTHIDNIRNEDQFLNFFKFCFLRNEPDIALEQAIIKTPIKSNFLFFSYIEKIVLSIKENQEILLRYLNRTTFLNNTWRFIDLYLSHLDNHEDKLKIIKKISKTNAFRIPNNQKDIYNSAKDYIDNYQDLLSYFTHLMEIKEDESIVNSIEYPHTIIIKFTPQKLLNANLTNI